MNRKKGILKTGQIPWRLRRLSSVWLAVLMMISVCLTSPTGVQKVYAEELSLEAPSAILIEASTGTVLYEKNADEKMRPASVTKVMTLLLAFEQIGAGKMTLTDTVTISEHAASMEGSRCFFEAGEQQSVEDIIKCIIIASGNDTAVAMGEHIAGSEEAFVGMMNERAASLGMVNSHFENACGLEAKGHLTTCRDIAIMSRELTTRYPEIFEYSTIWMDSITHVTRRGSDEFTLANTNKFLKEYTGATGLKTGYTSVAKYSMAATATRDGVDLIAVVMGAETKEIRNETAGKLLDYGFAKCKVYEDAQPFANVGEIHIAGGKSSMVKYNTEGTFSHVFTGGEDMTQIEKQFVQTVDKAPVRAGEEIGNVTYSIGGNMISEFPVTALEDVEAIDYKFCFLKLLFRYMNV